MIVESTVRQTSFAPRFGLPDDIAGEPLVGLKIQLKPQRGGRDAAMSAIAVVVPMLTIQVIAAAAAPRAVASFLRMEDPW